MTHDERLARVALTAVVEPGDVAVLDLVEAEGVVSTWARIAARDATLPDAVRRVATSRLDGLDPARLLADAAAQQVRFICPGDDEWPPSIEDLDNTARRGTARAPLGLWARGPLPLAGVTERAVAVVGSRSATDYGSWVTGTLAAALADRGWTVVSGAAYGIDAAAHRGSFAAGGATVAVVANGVDGVYPSGNHMLFGRLASQGLIVSEWPPGATPTAQRFLVRNRVIAALCRGTVVVEAGLRSGALATSRWARDLLRVRMFVPGPVTSAMSAGCHRELREPGTLLVTSADEVVEAVGRIGDDLATPVSGPTDPRDLLGPTQRRVLEALPARGARRLAWIAAACGLTQPEVRAELAVLAGAGWVIADDGTFRLSPAARPLRQRSSWGAGGASGPGSGPSAQLLIPDSS